MTEQPLTRRAMREAHARSLPPTTRREARARDGRVVEHAPTAPKTRRELAALRAQSSVPTAGEVLSVPEMPTATNAPIATNAPTVEVLPAVVTAAAAPGPAPVEASEAVFNAELVDTAELFGQSRGVSSAPQSLLVREHRARPVRQQLAIAPPARRKKPRHLAAFQKIRASVVIAATGSLVAVGAIPAYGFTAIETPEAVFSGGASQSLAVQGELAEHSTLQYDAFETFVVGQNRETVDDYPFPGKRGMSSLMYYMGQCVDFVAWRMNRDLGWTEGPWLIKWGQGLPPGSAWMWASAWKYGTGMEPKVGAVAWWRANHVAYVSAVYDDGTFQIEEYNVNSDSSYHTRILTTSQVDLFLYPPSPATTGE